MLIKCYNITNIINRVRGIHDATVVKVMPEPHQFSSLHYSLIMFDDRSIYLETSAGT